MIELSKSIFYHMPRTGGGWVIDALKNACPNAKTGLVHGKEKDYPKGDKKAFTFIRDPISWYESSYWNEHERRPQYGNWIFCKYCDKDINYCVGRMFANHNGFISNYVKDFCENMDFIGKRRGRSNAEDLMNILDEIGEEYDKDKLLATPRRGARDYPIKMTEYSMELVNHSEAYIIEKFYKDQLVCS